jgi:hypothetical protein
VFQVESLFLFVAVLALFLHVPLAQRLHEHKRLRTASFSIAKGDASQR